MEPLIELKDVHKRLGGATVLAGVDLAVLRGETLVIIGRSGAGKSVITRHMVGLLLPDSGTARAFGVDLKRAGRRELDAVRLRMGYLFQSGALLNWMTIAENVELPLLEHRRALSRRQRMDIVMQKLRMVEMADAAGKRPDEVSGGMKKRAALARAVALDPEVIFYDEPTSGLDPVIARAIDELIIATQARTGATQVVVTHDMESAYRIGKRIAMIHEGRIRFCGPPEELRATEDPVARQFITGNPHGPLTDTAE